jgi:hypothetical protein
MPVVPGDSAGTDSYVEFLQEVMPSVRSKIIGDERSSSILPLLNIESQSRGQQ